MPIHAQFNLICAGIIKIESDRMVGVNFGSLRQLWRLPIVGRWLRLCAQSQANSEQKDTKPAEVEG